MGSEAVEAAAYAAKYRKYERDYLRRLNHLYFSNKTADNVGELFESSATIDDFVIKESKEAPIKKYSATSGLESKDSLTPKPDAPDTDANLPSSSTKKVQRATPEGNRKPTARGSYRRESERVILLRLHVGLLSSLLTITHGEVVRVT